MQTMRRTDPRMEAQRRRVLFGALPGPLAPQAEDLHAAASRARGEGMRPMRQAIPGAQGDQVLRGPLQQRHGPRTLATAARSARGSAGEGLPSLRSDLHHAPGHAGQLQSEVRPVRPQQAPDRQAAKDRRAPAGLASDDRTPGRCHPSRLESGDQIRAPRSCPPCTRRP